MEMYMAWVNELVRLCVHKSVHSLPVILRSGNALGYISDDEVTAETSHWTANVEVHSSNL